MASFIDPIGKSSVVNEVLPMYGAEGLRWALWGTYWWFQGLAMTGLWVIGHEVRESVSCLTCFYFRFKFAGSIDDGHEH